MRKNLGAKPFIFPQPVLVIGSYNDDDSANAMVAAWGCMADMNKVAIYVAASHKSMENILKRKSFTVAMANAKNVVAVDYLGVVSGNNVVGKFAKSGFTAAKSEFVDAPVIAELPLTLECKVESYDAEAELLLGEIMNVSAEESVLDAAGKVDMTKLAPICYDPSGHGYFAIGAKVGQAFSDGKNLK